jgi:hypothetical protein
MSLTLAQKQALKTHALNNQTQLAFPAGQATIASKFAAASLQSADALLIANWYNLLTSPAAYAWHFSRSRMDNRRAVMNTAGSANQLDALTGAKRDALLWCIDDTIDCRLAAVRTSIDDLCGSQNTLKAAILDSFKRQLRNLERVFSTGGDGSLSTPHDYVFEGTVTGDEISDVHGVTLP